MRGSKHTACKATDWTHWLDATVPPRLTTADVGDYSELFPDWRRHLRAANRAASTVRRYEKDTRTRHHTDRHTA